jgi:hypothetical protein
MCHGIRVGVLTRNAVPCGAWPRVLPERSALSGGYLVAGPLLAGRPLTGHPGRRLCGGQGPAGLVDPHDEP